MRVPIPLQTVYAELLERLMLEEIAHEFPSFGGFAHKTVKGKRYIYWQGQSGGVRKQKFVGPDEPATWARIERAKQIKQSDDERARLVDALASAGFPVAPAAGGRILNALARAGTFRRGGCLIGTWSFLAYGPMLGEILPAGLAQTQDLDILQIELASDEVPVNLPSVLKEVDRTFTAMTSLMDDAPPYAFRNAEGYRVEFMTVQSRKAARKPVLIANLGVGAMPLPFLEYLLESPVDAAALFRSGVLIKVPAPERFALHKLIVAERRGASSTPAKKQKDIAQAQTLLTVLIEERPRLVRQAWRDLLRRGPAWSRNARASLKRLDDATQRFLNAAN
jgi:hypothetical protein